MELKLTVLEVDPRRAGCLDEDDGLAVQSYWGNGYSVRGDGDANGVWKLSVDLR